jgi:hypothetical protein
LLYLTPAIPLCAQVTGALTGDVCTVSSETALTNPGAAKSYSLMCYVSASDTVILVLTIGAAAIGMGTGPSNVENGFKVNVAVISFTS